MAMATVKQRAIEWVLGVVLAFSFRHEALNSKNGTTRQGLASRLTLFQFVFLWWFVLMCT
jgi:hypothetical protein